MCPYVYACMPMCLCMYMHTDVCMYMGVGTCLPAYMHISICVCRYSKWVGKLMELNFFCSVFSGCMIGNHGYQVILDAYVKGIRAFDTQAALVAMY